jgi:hypothetical protein
MIPTVPERVTVRSVNVQDFACFIAVASCLTGLVVGLLFPLWAGRLDPKGQPPAFDGTYLRNWGLITAWLTIGGFFGGLVAGVIQGFVINLALRMVRGVEFTVAKRR